MCVCTEATIGKDSQLVKNAKTEILNSFIWTTKKESEQKVQNQDFADEMRGTIYKSFIEGL